MSDTNTLTRIAASLRRAVADGLLQLVERPIYVAMVLVPIAVALLFLSLMSEGLPTKLPAAIVDLDHTPLSRRITRNLNASELNTIDYTVNSHEEAMKLVEGGKVYGFFMIPNGFEADAVAGRPTTITIYTNMAYYVPGTLSYKQLKTTAVTTSGKIVATTLVGAGIDANFVSTMIQPVVTQTHPLGNPWSNYSIYLTNSFIPCLLQLIIMQVTVFSILEEIKKRRSAQWLERAGGRISVAVAGKLIPQFVIFGLVGMAILGLFYGISGFPQQGSIISMVVAMLLLVAASQAFGVFIAAIMPNMRLALSIVSLFGILAFSIAGFSFPVEQMYGAVGIFSWLMPIRYYFLIYINVALNGYPVWYVRWEYVAMILFMLLPLTALWKLKRQSANPVYLT